MRLRTARYWSLLGSIVSVVLLSGCAGPLHKALNPAEITSIKQTDVRATVVQEEVTIHVVKSTAGDNVAAGGGVCCALMGSVIDKSVDASRSKRAEAWVAPLLEQTSDVDFRKDYWDAVIPTLRSLPWMRVGETELASTGKEIPKEWMDNNVLLLQANYELTPEGRFLVVTSLAQFWSNPKSKPSYYSFYSYVSEAVGAPSASPGETAAPSPASGEAAVAMWAQNGAALYRAALHESIQEIIRMIRFDLPDSNQNMQHMSGSPAKIKIPSLTGGHGRDSVSGEILDRSADRIIFRRKDGNLLSLPLADIEISE